MYIESFICNRHKSWAEESQKSFNLKGRRRFQRLTGMIERGQTGEVSIIDALVNNDLNFNVKTYPVDIDEIREYE